MTKDVLFNNSNLLYNLRYEAAFEDMPRVTKQLTFNPKTEPEASQRSPTIPMPQHSNTASVLQNPTFTPLPATRSTSPYEPHSFPPPPKASQVYDVTRYDAFMKQNPDIKFIYVQWLDYMATMRVRIVPIKEFGRIIREGERIGISQGNTGTLQNDRLTPVVNTTGQIFIEPDLRSLRRAHKKDPFTAATVLSYWRSEDGMPIDECPRHNLEALISSLQYNHNTTLLCGFEIEVTFLSRSTTNANQPYEPLTKIHAWSTMTPEQWLQMPFIAEIITSLEEMGIDIQQFHAESGPGQYEFILPPLPPLLAVDTLIQTRQVIAQIAATHGLRATLHPKPSQGAGTAAHAHISLHPPDRDLEFFVGGVLKHLPSLCAFTMPEAVSYDRVIDDQWTGGTWVEWGTQNRETPLRRVKGGRWELRCLDGMANMYLVLAAVIAAGLLGLSTGSMEFAQKDLPYNPSTLNEEERVHFGVVEKMPTSINEALATLRADGELTEAMAHGLVRNFITMKESEQRMLERMPEAERRVWLIERY
jgi:glutamine synthetase